MMRIEALVFRYAPLKRKELLKVFGRYLTVYLVALVAVLVVNWGDEEHFRGELANIKYVGGLMMIFGAYATLM
jgi:hypothetical protein